MTHQIRAAEAEADESVRRRLREMGCAEAETAGPYLLDALLAKYRLPPRWGFTDEPSASAAATQPDRLSKTGLLVAPDAPALEVTEGMFEVSPEEDEAAARFFADDG